MTIAIAGVSERSGCQLHWQWQHSTSGLEHSTQQVTPDPPLLVSNIVIVSLKSRERSEAREAKTSAAVASDNGPKKSGNIVTVYPHLLVSDIVLVSVHGSDPASEDSKESRCQWQCRLELSTDSIF